MGIKTYIQIAVLLSLIVSGAYAFKTMTIVKKSKVKKLEALVATKEFQISKLDSSIYSLQQDVDLKIKTDGEFQIIVNNLNEENKSLKRKSIELNSLISKIESNGNMRFFEKPFLNKCYREVFVKPNCVKD